MCEVEYTFYLRLAYFFSLCCLYVNIFKKKRKKAVFELKSPGFFGTKILPLLLNNCIMTSFASDLCLICRYFQSQCNFVQLLQVFINDLMRLFHRTDCWKVEPRTFTWWWWWWWCWRWILMSVEYYSFVLSHCVILLPKPDSQRTHEFQLKDWWRLKPFLFIG